LWAQLYKLFAKSLWSHRQISISGTQPNLSHVRRERWKQTVQISSLLKPRRHPMNGKRVSQIMHARMASAVMSCHSRNPAKPLETLTQCEFIYRLAISR
jgi:hypothetical protein